MAESCAQPFQVEIKLDQNIPKKVRKTGYMYSNGFDLINLFDRLGKLSKTSRGVCRFLFFWGGVHYENMSMRI